MQGRAFERYIPFNDLETNYINEILILINKGHSPMMTYGDIIVIELETDILVLKLVSKFHKVVIKITGLRDWTPSKKVNFHEQRAITPEGMMRSI